MAANERRVVVDPVTRIEGHLRVQAMLNQNNVITDAMSTGTMWRGLEVILKGRRVGLCRTHLRCLYGYSCVGGRARCGRCHRHQDSEERQYHP